MSLEATLSKLTALDAKAVIALWDSEPISEYRAKRLEKMGLVYWLPGIPPYDFELWPHLTTLGEQAIEKLIPDEERGFPSLNP